MPSPGRRRWVEVVEVDVVEVEAEVEVELRGRMCVCSCVCVCVVCVGGMPQDVSRARSSKNGSLKRDAGMPVGFCFGASPCLDLPRSFVFTYFAWSIQMLS
mgnify:FL=1